MTSTNKKRSEGAAAKRKLKAAQLRSAWGSVHKNRPLKQMDLVREYQVTQGFISHLMNGRKDIPVEWQLRFARYLDMPPQEIWPDFEYADICVGREDPRVTQILHALPDLSEAQFNAVLAIIRQMQPR